VPVLFTPGANYESAAEHTVALLLALARRIPDEDRRIRRGTFDKAAYAGLELRGKTLGLVGYGRIGRRVAELVGPFGMRVLAYHPSPAPEALPAHVSEVASLDALLGASDVVSLHCPLTEGTRALIGADALARMKPGAFLVNTSRGGVVVESELTEALRAGRLAGAALDVFAEEPLPAGHPLLELDNVIVTTHVAGVSWWG
jgi:D-3-phosphoglycerate dehydrogenase